MNIAFKKIKYAPIMIGIAYLLFTVLLFFVGPFDWPIKNSDTLSLFLASCFLALILGFWLGVYKSEQQKSFDSWKFYFRLGAVASVALLFPSTYAYTGKWPWEIFSVIGNQGTAYGEMLAALAANESGIRAYVALARGLFAPFVFCVIPLGILNWKKLNYIDVFLLGAHLFAILIFSFMRGTDRETGDLVFFVFATIILVICRRIVNRGRLSFKLSQFIIWPLLLSIIFLSALSLFIDRKESRMGGTEAFCIAEGVVCSAHDPNASSFERKSMFGIEMISAYLSQGYYGLSLALNEDFTSTFGLGHSAFLTNVFTKAVDDSIYERSYLYKERAVGWDDRSQWSTIFPWIASDVGFPVVPFVICGIGFLWGAAWRSAVCGKNDTAVLVYLFLCLLVVYIPANNQLTQTFDSYFSFLFWLIFWAFQRTRK
ncbi:hypothetical protein LSG25_14400 [Paralcaligenes sp. KSB-10]|uniref:hypothetical protein n=1 Tax=Paralcaligenes sp. KSB-10 TaxID=2901142 RepID=UPI001E3F4EE8|nr:hypothetical protein [Paralcaligenes sp. KSB-10]UHL63240.1 hypothetical protein LSG25_14400 [Paralcaligenes sp. KSB-10]